MMKLTTIVLKGTLTVFTASPPFLRPQVSSCLLVATSWVYRISNRCNSDGCIYGQLPRARRTAHNGINEVILTNTTRFIFGRLCGGGTWG
ncbi:hypothetical protein OPQ81_005605 [Rhizoctonia solani]|nr:hypothetical protein OPQ81_005605 [Rhizoctonia solani]